eukprot:s641_g21.t1
MVEAQNVPVLVKSNVVVGRLVDAAKSAGAPTNGLVVDTAGRQRMLIQRMCKEALLIGHLAHGPVDFFCHLMWQFPAFPVDFLSIFGVENGY